MTLEIQQAAILAGLQQERRLEYRAALGKMCGGCMRSALLVMQSQQGVILPDSGWTQCLTILCQTGTIAHVEVLLQQSLKRTRERENKSNGTVNKPAGGTIGG